MKKLLVNIYLAYLRFFAKIQLRKIHPVVIGVGGAAGKTSTALLISQILSRKFVVKQSKGKNSETGIPLNILDITLSSYGFFDWLRAAFLAPLKIITNFKKYEILVAEMGIDSPYPPKNMGYLLKILKPSSGVLTNIDLEHSLNFDPLIETEDEEERKKEILVLTAKEEGKLLKSIPEIGRSVVNLDDRNIARLLPLRSKTVTVSARRKDADYYISKIDVSEDKFEINFIYLKENYKISINQPLPKYFAYSFVLAIATCFPFGINIADCINNLSEKFSLPPGRFSALRGIKNSLILDSSYNSSLSAVKGALDVLPQIAKGRRKVGILGDMRELGSLTQIQHEELAKAILKNLDFAILIGPAMLEFIVPVLQSENFEFMAFETFSKAKKTIEEKIRTKDLILVKGSQNELFLERAVELLLFDKKDKDKLCRRGSYWDKKRKETP